MCHFSDSSGTGRRKSWMIAGRREKHFMMVVLFRLTSRSANNLMSQTAADSRAFLQSQIWNAWWVKSVTRYSSLTRSPWPALLSVQRPGFCFSHSWSQMKQNECRFSGTSSAVQRNRTSLVLGTKKTPFPGKVLNFFHIIGTFWTNFQQLDL